MILRFLHNKCWGPLHLQCKEFKFTRLSTKAHSMIKGIISTYTKIQGEFISGFCILYDILLVSFPLSKLFVHVRTCVHGLWLWPAPYE